MLYEVITVVLLPDSEPELRHGSVQVAREFGQRLRGFPCLLHGMVGLMHHAGDTFDILGNGRFCRTNS